MFLIDDILLAPLSGFKFVLRTLQRVAEEQYTDDAPLKERLLELQMKLETGEVSEEQYVAEEAEILRELRAVQNRKREMAGLPPQEPGGFTGKVQEGSRAEITFTPPPHEPECPAPPVLRMTIVN